VLHRQVLMTTEEMTAAAVRLGLSHAKAIRLVQDAWKAGRLVWAGVYNCRRSLVQSSPPKRTLNP